MTIVNTTGRRMLITDLKIAGKSAMSQIVDDLFVKGDIVTPLGPIVLMPGETITVEADQANWLEDWGTVVFPGSQGAVG